MTEKLAETAPNPDPGSIRAMQTSLAFIKAAMNEEIDQQEVITTPPNHPDDEAAERFCAKMKYKLGLARQRGKSGWDDPNWTPEMISQALREHVDKGDPVDVANYCMFLAARKEPICAAPQPDESELDGTVAAHPAWWRGFQAGMRDIKAQSAQDVMINMTPPATARDRWMYEQGRLAERDPRTRAIESKAAPEPQPVKQAPIKSFKELDYKVGWQRYEKVRRLNAHQFSELFQRGLKGERFDEMVDGLEAKP